MNTSSQEDIASLLFSFVRKVGKSVRGADQKDSLSFAHLKTFYLISEHSLPTMKDVAQYFGITPPSATSMINRFVKEGYIRRMLDPADRRTIRLELTPLGKQKLQVCTKLMSQKTNELIENLSHVEKKEFVRIMKKIIDN